MSKVLVTGGHGFIGSNLIRWLLCNRPYNIVNIDALTYAGNPSNLAHVLPHSRYNFYHVDILDEAEVSRVFSQENPDCVIHLAAESHVDRSIDAPGKFLATNAMGTLNVLQAFRKCYEDTSESLQSRMRFLHVSTDEVFGSLGCDGLFDESTPYDPHSPYAASKAASDHVARAWHDTFDVPVIVTNCSNNYGPFQFPEKLIPVVILNAINDREIPIYGDGENVRDWLYVEDHVRALECVLCGGLPGQTYAIGGDNQLTNNELVKTICMTLDRLHPRTDGRSYFEQVVYVKDRPGHDRRYAINAGKIRRELDWIPKETYQDGIEKTVRWYLENQPWWQAILEDRYQLQRLGSLKE
ncbi:dTDP-glucose 4,6-dehydratase [Stieleria sp. TO1_6]|nr:dTDP-glucose 4,6-dehydratase [Stieleria tagensis]